MAKFIVFLGLVALAAAQTNYNAGDSGRYETVSPDGSVQGQYSYQDPNGKTITVKYRAGKDGFQVEGDHLPKAPSAPQHPAPHVPPQAPTHPPLPQHPASGYNPFHNPHVAAHLYQQAPTHPPVAPTHPPLPQHPASASGYNPFHNPHVAAHLYQQAPTHPPVAPTHPPLPQHPASVSAYNPFVNPHVPSHLYQNAPQNHHQPSSAPGTFSGFGHPNSIPPQQFKPSGGRGPAKVSVSQQPTGFTYNFETS